LYRLAVLISGNGSNLQAVIDAVSDGTIPNAKVELVISSREGVYGLERAKKHGITSNVIDRHDSKKQFEALEDHKIDGIVLAGYLSLLPPDVIKKYNRRIINIHPALLPMFGGKGFYGIRVHQAALTAGVKFTGATAHLVELDYDTGDTLIRSVVPVLEGDTAEILQKRVLEAEHKILVHAVKALTENKIDELVKKPITLIREEDKESIIEFAQGFNKLYGALTEADNGEL